MWSREKERLSLLSSSPPGEAGDGPGGVSHSCSQAPGACRASEVRLVYTSTDVYVYTVARTQERGETAKFAKSTVNSKVLTTHCTVQYE